MIKTYSLLTKPGIIIGNLITAAGAFALGSRHGFDFLLFFYTMLGLGCVIGSACVFNNVIDREADQKMIRTKNRPLAKGIITPKSALSFAVFLGLFGLFFLFWKTNILVLGTVLFGFLIYVILYSFWKYKTSHATLMGSIAGAIPPVAGYCSASGSFDLGALLLFILLVFWQMSHFFSIALYRVHEYRNAEIPILPVEQGEKRTKIEILLYTIAFCVTGLFLNLLGYTGPIYVTLLVLSGSYWIILSFKGFKAKNSQIWARQMFRYSLVVITLFSIAIAIK